jgi:hypothetical protein
MYSHGLIASQCSQPPGPRSQQAYNAEFGVVPFAGLRNAIRAVGGRVRRVHVLGSGPGRDRRAASVL